jgi:putative chitinase
MASLEQIQAAFPQAKPQRIAELYEGFLEAFDLFEINTPARQAAFLAQCAHESGNFNAMVENLNYGAKGLMGTFHKYFLDEATALHYERKPELIANRVYANRMGNGDEASGDGYRYRGRGLIQVTGKSNYAACGEALGADLLSEPELLETSPGAVLSAGWFWAANNLNQYADAGDILTMTKRINGGTIGLEDRTAHYNHALHILVG